MTDLSWAALTPALPELFLALAGLVLLMLGTFIRGDAARIVSIGAILSFVVAAVLVVRAGGQDASLLNGFFVFDRFAAFTKLTVLAGLAAATALSVRYLYQEGMQRYEYPVLIVFAGLGMLMMLSAGNLLSLYMGLELQSLSLYVLAAIRRDSARSSEAGMKYFVLGALASGMLLFGISLIYGFIGSISFATIGQTLAAMENIGPGLTVGLVFVLVGIAFKISAVPFHMWTPDVYEGAPSSVTALFAIVPKMAAVGLLMRLLFEPFGAVAVQWQQVIWFLSAASMVWAAFAGIGQTNIKRLMAYSSIGNMGYALMGLAAGNVAGAGAVLVYMVIYMIMSAGVFGIILHMRRGGRELEAIGDLAGLSRTGPLWAYAMAFLMFSMSGIPPLAGFFGKLFVFQAAVAAGLYPLAVIGVLSSVVAAYYYLKIIKVMFFDAPEAVPFDRDTGFALRAVVGLSVLFILLFILMPGPLVDTSGTAAAALFGG